MEMCYTEMTTSEIIDYYKKVKEYIDQGFRVDGLKDELNLISKTLLCKKQELCKSELQKYLLEIEKYKKIIRH